MPEPPGSASPWQRRLLLIFVAGLYTLLVLQWSARHGRLAQAITFDDNGYFVDGLQRLTALQTGGVPALWKSLSAQPPHSPFSTLMAMAAFALFGVNDWAPYALNGLLILWLVFILDHCARTLPSGQRLGAVLLGLSVPFCFNFIHDFRPDCAVALATATGVVLCVEAALERPGRARPRAGEAKLALGGLCFGLAFLFKPPFFPHTAVLGAVMAGMVLAIGRGWAGGGSLPASTLTRRLAVLAATSLLPPLPFYLLDFRHIFGYFAVNTGAGVDAELWRIKGGMLESAYKYVIDGPMAGMIGNYVWVFGGVVILTIVIGLARRRPGLWQAPIGIVAGVAASLAIMIYGRYANSFFGITYQLLLLFGTILAVASLRRESPVWARVSTGVIALAFAWNLLAPGGNLYARTLIGPPVLEVDPISRALVSAVRGQLPALPVGVARGPVRVAFTFAGDVNANTLHWIAMKEGLELRMDDLNRATKPGDLVIGSSENEFVVVAEPGTVGPYSWLPSSNLQAAALEGLQRDGRWREIARLPARGGGYRLFRQENLVAAGWPFPTEGLLPVEGPYPQWKMGLVRWGILPATRLTLVARAETRATLRMECRAQPGQRLALLVNGQEAGSHAFTTNDFSAISVAVNLRAGENLLELRYETGEPVAADGNRRAVLFRRFDLLRE